MITTPRPTRQVVPDPTREVVRRQTRTPAPHHRPGRWRPGTTAACPSDGPRSASPPGTATTPTRHRTACGPRPTIGAEHDRPGAPVELQPQPRLGDPRPIRPPVPLGIGGLRSGDGPAG